MKKLNISHILAPYRFRWKLLLSKYLRSIEKVWYDKLRPCPHHTLPRVEQQEIDISFLTFTSGTTGPPKINERTFENDTSTLAALKNILNHTGGKVLSDFASFSFFGPSINSTSILFQFRNKKDQMAKILKYLYNNIVTTLILSTECLLFIIKNTNTKIRVTNLIFGGESIGLYIAERIKAVFEYQDCKILFGCSEAEPVCHISLETYIARMKTACPTNGVCIGYANDNIMIHNDTLHVTGAHVVKSYANNEVSNREIKKIINGTLWHNMGDICHKDEHGMIWTFGRGCKETFIATNKVTAIHGIIEAVCEFVDQTLYIVYETDNTNIDISNTLKNTFPNNNVVIKKIKDMPRTPSGKINKEKIIKYMKRGGKIIYIN